MEPLLCRSSSGTAASGIGAFGSPGTPFPAWSRTPPSAWASSWGWSWAVCRNSGPRDHKAGGCPHRPAHGRHIWRPYSSSFRRRRSMVRRSMRGHLYLAHPPAPGRSAPGSCPGSTAAGSPGAPGRGRLPTAARRASRSTMPSSMPSVPSTLSRVRPSPVSIWREATGRLASSAAAISSGSRPVSAPSSDRVGSRPSRADSLSRAERMAPARSFSPPAHLHRPVVPQEPPDLSGDLGHGVGGELATEGGVKPPHRLEKAQAAQLIQVLRLHPPGRNSA